MGNCNVGDTYGFEVTPCHHNGETYTIAHIGCNKCHRRMNGRLFFACETCTSGKINCEKSYETCADCLKGHDIQGHTVLMYMQMRCVGRVTSTTGRGRLKIILSDKWCAIYNERDHTTAFVNIATGAVSDRLPDLVVSDDEDEGEDKPDSPQNIGSNKSSHSKRVTILSGGKGHGTTNKDGTPSTTRSGRRRMKTLAFEPGLSLDQFAAALTGVRGLGHELTEDEQLLFGELSDLAASPLAGDAANPNEGLLGVASMLPGPPDGTQPAPTGPVAAPATAAATAPQLGSVAEGSPLAAVSPLAAASPFLGEASPRLAASPLAASPAPAVQQPLLYAAAQPPLQAVQRPPLQQAAATLPQPPPSFLARAPGSPGPPVARQILQPGQILLPPTARGRTTQARQLPRSMPAGFVARSLSPSASTRPAAVGGYACGGGVPVGGSLRMAAAASDGTALHQGGGMYMTATVSDGTALGGQHLSSQVPRALGDAPLSSPEAYGAAGAAPQFFTLQPGQDGTMVMVPAPPPPFNVSLNEIYGGSFRSQPGGADAFAYEDTVAMGPSPRVGRLVGEGADGGPEGDLGEIRMSATGDLVAMGPGGGLLQPLTDEEVAALGLFMEEEEEVEVEVEEGDFVQEEVEADAGLPSLPPRPAAARSSPALLAEGPDSPLQVPRRATDFARRQRQPQGDGQAQAQAQAEADAEAEAEAGAELEGEDGQDGVALGADGLPLPPPPPGQQKAPRRVVVRRVPLRHAATGLPDGSAPMADEGAMRHAASDGAALVPRFRALPSQQARGLGAGAAAGGRYVRGPNGQWYVLRQPPAAPSGLPGLPGLAPPLLPPVHFPQMRMPHLPHVQMPHLPQMPLPQMPFGQPPMQRYYVRDQAGQWQLMTGGYPGHAPRAPYLRDAHGRLVFGGSSAGAAAGQVPHPFARPVAPRYVRDPSGQWLLQHPQPLRQPQQRVVRDQSGKLVLLPAGYGMRPQRVRVVPRGAAGRYFGAPLAAAPAAAAPPAAAV